MENLNTAAAVVANGTHPALVGATQEGVVTRLLTTGVFYKAFAIGSNGQKALAELVAADKLSMSDIEVTEEKDETGAVVATTWKRKGAKLEVAVPVLTGKIEGLTPAQQQHVQEVIEAYLTNKQRPLFDALDGKFVKWPELLEGSYSQRKVAVKITAEMVKAACSALAQFLQIPEKAKGTVVQLAEKKFSGAVTRNTKPEVLERLLTLVLEAAAAYEEAAPSEFNTHAPVFELWATNIQEALQPAEDDGLSLDDLMPVDA